MPTPKRKRLFWLLDRALRLVRGLEMRGEEGRLGKTGDLPSYGAPTGPVRPSLPAARLTANEAGSLLPRLLLQRVLRRWLFCLLCRTGDFYPVAHVRVDAVEVVRWNCDVERLAGCRALVGKAPRRRVAGRRDGQAGSRMGTNEDEGHEKTLRHGRLKKNRAGVILPCLVLLVLNYLQDVGQS
jgi:hypothetical protein